MSRILNVNGDVIETFEYDEMNDRTIIKKTQDVEGYLDRNRAERNNQVSGWRGDLHKVASVPFVLIEEWCKEFGCNILAKENRHLLMLKLRNRDYNKLRTKEGQI